MSEEHGLDRSVLEGKKANELRDIAAAAGVSLPSRATKAGLIDQILRSTGVTVSDQSPDTSSEKRPTRSPTPRAKAGPPSTGVSRGDMVPPSQGPPSQAALSGMAMLAPAVVGPTLPEQTSRSQNGADSGSAVINPAPGQAPLSSTTPGGTGNADTTSRDPGNRETSNRDGATQRTDGPQRNDRNGRGFENYAAEGGPVNSRNQRRRRGRNNRDNSRDANRDRNDRPDRNDRGRGGEGFERDRNTEPSEVQFQGEPMPVTGFLELRDEGFGFLRTKGFLASPLDVYVPVSQVRKYGLRKGDSVEGTSRPATSSEKYPALLRVDRINGFDPEIARTRPKFEDLTPLFPDSKLRLEIPGDTANMTARIVDLISPIGKGQRGLIVSPPKAGKTTIMKQIAHSIEANNPDVHLMVLLVDERPEEVTDMRRSVKGEVIASTFDRPADEHTRVAELAIERAKRLVEQKIDVVIILDGITRLARAYNLAAPASGRILSGGVDSGALYPPKKFFGAARNVEEGGSLTILATALVETGSKMDEVIFEEFKGTGNMELRLDRRLAERRLYPAIEVNSSSTRHEELLFDRTQLNQVWKLRRVLNALSQDGNTAAGLELLMDKIKTTASNDEFLAEIAKNPTPVG